MAQEKSIEVKVGVLILVSLGILAAFVLIMGGLSFEKTYVLYVDFDNPGGLQTGAPVRVAGVKVGKVSELALRRSEYASALRRDGFDHLVDLVETKIADLKSKGRTDG